VRGDLRLMATDAVEQALRRLIDEHAASRAGVAALRERRAARRAATIARPIPPAAPVTRTTRGVVLAMVFSKFAAAFKLRFGDASSGGATEPPPSHPLHHPGRTRCKRKAVSAGARVFRRRIDRAQNGAAIAPCAAIAKSSNPQR
jgi:hypothetical protein